MCTRTLCSAGPEIKVVSRTLDVSIPAKPCFWWQPAGLRRLGGTDGKLEWTSRYPSLAITELGDVVVEGLNTTGLAVHLLMFTTAGYEPSDQRPGLLTSVWGQYVLDNCATVTEALDLLAGVRVEPVQVMDFPAGAHLAVTDVAGDTAIVEPIDGRMVVHHGRQYQVMTNAPSMDEQLANLANYRPFGGELPPPGDITSLDRFVRASYFLHYLPTPVTPRAALADVIHIANLAAKPEGAPYPSGEIYPTRWISAIDLVHLDYYYWSRTSPALAWVNLKDLGHRGEVAALDLDDHIAGDLATHFGPPDRPLPGIR
jgi:choloylglycine hydrolase